MKEDAEDLPGAHPAHGAGEMSEDEIDANVEGTFPASDPPAWTLGLDRRHPAGEEPEDDGA